MSKTPTQRLLTINTGSSSIKAALYDIAPRIALVAGLEFIRIGIAGGALRIAGPDGKGAAEVRREAPDHDTALRAIFEWLDAQGLGEGLAAVGHRVVHGGAQYSTPQAVTPGLLQVLDTLVPILPNHLPQGIAALRYIARTRPGLLQVACFDTSFHRSMPKVAQMFALPQRFFDAGVVRYGFHGLSYEYILNELQRLDPALAAGRLIVCHLGNGASMAAVRGGQGIDTTMGFSATTGLVMGTRSGDIDPGLLLYFMEHDGMSVPELKKLLNRDAGLVGVSGTSSDMRDLLAARATDPRAAEAIELFCYRARHYVGGYAAQLGGLDGIVFTGGIGERAGAIRAGICAGLEFLGVALDPEANAADADVISTAGSPAKVRVIRTNEELTIARHTAAVLAAGA